MKKVMGIGHGVIYLYDLCVKHRITMRVDHALDQLQEWFDVPVFDTPDKAEKNFLKNSFSDNDDRYENTLNIIDDRNE